MLNNLYDDLLVTKYNIVIYHLVYLNETYHSGYFAYIIFNIRSVEEI